MTKRKTVTKGADGGAYVRITKATHSALLKYCASRCVKVGAAADAAIRRALKLEGGK